MKKFLYLAVLFVGLTMTAQATLIGDTISATSTGMTTFNAGSVVVDNGFPEFYGTIDSGAGLIIDAEFNFGEDYLNIYLTSNLSGVNVPTDFSVSFTDIDWVGMPTFILTGVGEDFDVPNGTFAGLNPVVGNHSLTLNFESIEIDEFREIQITLEKAEDTGGPNNPVPEPTTIALLGMGVVGLVARRKLA